MADRKNVTWRIGDHPQRETINKWLDEQKNIQDTITNIALHMIERFGFKNITDYDIQKTLYNESLFITPTASSQEMNYVNSQNDSSSVETKTMENSKEIQASKHETNDTEENEKNSNNDIYNEIDMNNL